MLRPVLAALVLSLVAAPGRARADGPRAPFVSIDAPASEPRFTFRLGMPFGPALARSQVYRLDLYLQRPLELGLVRGGWYGALPAFYALNGWQRYGDYETYSETGVMAGLELGAFLEDTSGAFVGQAAFVLPKVTNFASQILDGGHSAALAQLSRPSDALRLQPGLAARVAGSFVHDLGGDFYRVLLGADLPLAGPAPTAVVTRAQVGAGRRVSGWTFTLEANASIYLPGALFAGLAGAVRRGAFWLAVELPLRPSSWTLVWGSVSLGVDV